MAKSDSTGLNPALDVLGVHLEEDLEGEEYSEGVRGLGEAPLVQVDLALEGVDRRRGVSAVSVTRFWCLATFQPKLPYPGLHGGSGYGICGMGIRVGSPGEGSFG